MNHVLMESQINELKEKFQVNEIIELDKRSPELFEKLSSLNGDENLQELVEHLLSIISQFDYAILPIGSPVFMFKLASEYSFQRYDSEIQTKILFAHSERKVIETIENNIVTKKSIFCHKKFIKI